MIFERGVEPWVRSKLTPKQRDEIRARYADGETAPALALEYGVGVRTITQYTSRRS